MTNEIETAEGRSGGEGGKCGALSMGPLGGGVSYFTRGGVSSAPGAHICTLEAGHMGAHAKVQLDPLSHCLAMQTIYAWDDEHTLSASVSFVEIETTIRVLPPSPESVA